MVHVSWMRLNGCWVMDDELRIVILWLMKLPSMVVVVVLASTGETSVHVKSVVVVVFASMVESNHNVKHAEEAGYVSMVRENSIAKIVKVLRYVIMKGLDCDAKIVNKCSQTCYHGRIRARFTACGGSSI